MHCRIGGTELLSGRRTVVGMPRPVWSGTISFGLVAIPIKLFHAVQHKSVSFNQLDERTMSRIRYRKVSDETGEEVPDEHIVKGYEVSKGRYVVVDPDELEPFIPAATKTIELEEFVDLDEIDPVYFDSAYYVAPDANPKPYVLLARAMEEAGKVAIGRFVMRNKQYTAAIRADRGPADDVDPGLRRRGRDAGHDRRAGRARRGRRVDERGADGRGARRVAERRVRAGQVPRRLPRAGARPDREEGRGRGVRGARGGGREAQDRRPDGRPRGERRRRPRRHASGTRPRRRRRRRPRSRPDRRAVAPTAARPVDGRGRRPRAGAVEPRQGAVSVGVHKGEVIDYYAAHRPGTRAAPRAAGR